MAYAVFLFIRILALWVLHTFSVTVFYKQPKRLIYPAVVESITERTSTHELMFMFTIKDEQSFRANFERVDAFTAYRLDALQDRKNDLEWLW